MLFWAIDYACLAAILVSAVAVVRTENLNGAVMALSAAGYAWQTPCPA